MSKASRCSREVWCGGLSDRWDLETGLVSMDLGPELAWHHSELASLSRGHVAIHRRELRP